MTFNKKTPKRWYKLDNSAVVYTSVKNKKYASVYRFTAVMKDEINKDILQEAVNITMVRFPYFSVKLRRGAFWYYLEEIGSPPQVKDDIINPCYPINLKEDNGHLVRIYYYNNKLSIEFFHAVSDGKGASVFLKTLMYVYCNIKYGTNIEAHVLKSYGIFDIDEEPKRTEYEDSYFHYGTSKYQMATKKEKAYHFRSAKELGHTVNIITGIMPLDKTLKLAKSYDASLTEYLVSLFIHTFYEIQKNEWHFKDKTIRIGVPVDLRKMFPSETMRNFILLSSPFIDPKLDDYTFEEIVYEIKTYMKYALNPKFLRAQMTMNIQTEINPFIRPIPLFIKNYVVKQFYIRIGAQQNTAQMTNLGIFTLPTALEEKVERIDVLMGKPFTTSPNAGIISYKNTLSLSFTSGVVGTDVEREFFRKLVRSGINVKIESNRE